MNSYDVVIVGGGIIGGSIALELCQRKLRVAVLDKQEFGREASWAAAGMLSPAPDCAAAIPLVRLARASLGLYPEYVQAVEEISSVDTGYRADGALELLCHGDGERELSTLVALHRGLGLACEPLSLDEALKMEPCLGRDIRAAALLPDEASVKPRELTAAVLSAAESIGATLISGTGVDSLIRDGNRCAGVKTSTGEQISAAEVVLAAGCWTSQLREAMPYAPTVPVRGQMLALRHTRKPIRRVLRSERGYIVPRGETSPQILVAGSTLENAGYEKLVTSGGIEQILASVIEIAPELADAELVETWCGLRPGTPDQMPILGPTDLDGLTIATGHYRNGILLAPVTGKLIAQWITERKTFFDWDQFSPMRFAPGKAKNRSDRSATAL